MSKLQLQHDIDEATTQDDELVLAEESTEENTEEKEQE
jgi:hypothetical protein